MTLKEALKAVDEDVLVKLTAKDGGAYMYAGTKQGLLDNMSDYDKEIRKHCKKALKRNRHERGNKLATLKETKSKSKKEKLEKEIKTYDDQIEWFECYQKNVPPLKDRIVTDVFLASAVVEPKPTMVFYIEGRESGNYWMVSETEFKDPFDVREIRRPTDGELPFANAKEAKA